MRDSVESTATACLAQQGPLHYKEMTQRLSLLPHRCLLGIYLCPLAIDIQGFIHI